MPARKVVPMNRKRLEREEIRNKALAVWESLNSHVTGATAGTVVAKLPAV